MTITLYELAGAEADRRFSSYCWRANLALRHKGLTFETVPWRFTEKDRIAFSGQGKVPVMTDGDHTVFDSWTIAEDLERRYPDRPSLFGGDQGHALSRFVTDWTDTVVLPAISRMIVTDIYDRVHDKDRDYFRKTREARFGLPLEQVTADRDTRLPAFRDSLMPLRRTLENQRFLAGDQPAWADYAVFSAFQWARCISPFRLLDEADILWNWRDRLLDLYDGAAREAPAYY